MIELAIAGHPAFRVERIEKELPPPSYTAETLAELHRRHPDHEFYLMMGSDRLPDLPVVRAAAGDRAGGVGGGAAARGDALDGRAAGAGRWAWNCQRCGCGSWPSAR